MLKNGSAISFAVGLVIGIFVGMVAFEGNSNTRMIADSAERDKLTREAQIAAAAGEWWYWEAEKVYRERLQKGLLDWYTKEEEQAKWRDVAELWLRGVPEEQILAAEE